jgi:chemotaxis response regulator CheB
MTQPIRVVVANRPRLMRELVAQMISEQPDIEIVAEIQNEAEVVQAVESTHPDFVIIALEESSRCSSLCSALLHSHPEMKILALAPERNCSIFYWASLDIHSSSVEASEAGILSTLRNKGEVVGG